MLSFFLSRSLSHKSYCLTFLLRKKDLKEREREEDTFSLMAATNWKLVVFSSSRNDKKEIWAARRKDGWKWTLFYFEIEASMSLQKHVSTEERGSLLGSIFALISSRNFPRAISLFRVRGKFSSSFVEELHRGMRIFFVSSKVERTVENILKTETVWKKKLICTR